MSDHNKTIIEQIMADGDYVMTYCKCSGTQTGGEGAGCFAFGQ